jgi:hypothetical protein
VSGLVEPLPENRFLDHGEERIYPRGEGLRVTVKMTIVIAD